MAASVEARSHAGCENSVARRTKCKTQRPAAALPAEVLTTRRPKTADAGTRSTRTTKATLLWPPGKEEAAVRSPRRTFPTGRLADEQTARPRQSLGKCLHTTRTRIFYTSYGSFYPTAVISTLFRIYKARYEYYFFLYTYAQKNR